ncbi:MAG: hypothetical protein LBI30_01570 [Holosporales bacterium]|nr:hypothetical protein [Holosporales bacterium]
MRTGSGELASVQESGLDHYGFSTICALIEIKKYCVTPIRDAFELSLTRLNIIARAGNLWPSYFVVEDIIAALDFLRQRAVEYIP